MSLRNNACPCCGSSLLRHARQGGIYWFCTSCWQEVPLLAVGQQSRLDPIGVRSRLAGSANG